MKNILDSIANKTPNSLKGLTTKHGRAVASVLVFAFIGSIVIAFSRAAVPTSTIEPEASSATLAGCVSKTTDATASEGGAVKFGCSGSGVLGLDNSGKTIPPHDYPEPPAGTAIYISPAGPDKNSNSVDGNDANDGSTVNNPVKTINRAIALVKSTNKKTIVMRGGEYRDWHSTSDGKFIQYETASFILQAYKQESPWFNGADIVSDWNSAGNNVWSHENWNTPDFCSPGRYYTPIEGNKPPFYPTWDPDVTVRSACGYADSLRNNTKVAGDPQSVFINDIKLTQVSSLSQVTANSFFYDWYTKKMYIGQNPSGKKVELAKRTQAFMLNKGLDGGQYAFKGIGFKRYASGGGDGSPDNFTIMNTVFLNEPQKPMIIENSVFVDNSGAGLGFSRPKDSKVTNSVFAYNGYAGLQGNGSRSAGNGARDDFTIETNVFNANNDQHFDVKCSQACGAANIKLNNMVGTIVKNNIAENAQSGAYGIWCDINCSEVNIVNNISKNNAKVGIFYEISRNGVIASNLAIDNGEDGIGVTSSNTKVYNNTVVFDRAKSSLARGIHIFDDSRASVCWYNNPGIGPDTRDVELANNVVYARSGGELSASIDNREAGGDTCPPSTTTNTKTSQFYNVFDYNAYHRTASDAAFYAWRYDNGTIDYGIRSTSAFTNATGWDSHSIDESGSTDTFFVDKANGDYSLKTNSQPYINKGKPIPSDVAAKLGIPANSVLPRGAISWPQ